MRNLLAFARRQAAARAPQDIADLLSRVLALRAYEFRLNGIELVTDFEPGLPPVLADGGQLQQALLNLAAQRRTGDARRPTERLHVGRAATTRSRRAVELFIADTGHGIERRRTCRAFSIRSSRRATSARAPASA